MTATNEGNARMVAYLLRSGADPIRSDSLPARKQGPGDTRSG